MPGIGVRTASNILLGIGGDIAEIDPWNSLCSAASAGRTSLKFTPTRDFIIRLACPDSGSANFTQPLLMTEADWNQMRALGEGYFDGDLMPLTNGGCSYVFVNSLGS